MDFTKTQKSRYLENETIFLQIKKLLIVMRCAVWYHLHNLKNVKNTHGGVLLATLLKVTLLHGCFSRFPNCTNDPNRAEHRSGDNL